MHDADNLTPLVSVVICTYNRAGLLTDALQTLCDQTIDKSLYEVIVVDNNSKDDTRAVTEDFSLRFQNVKYYFETRQGLSHARNRGWREANGPYVAYIDDDCKVPRRWLKTATEIIRQIAPAAFGGPYHAFYNSPKPFWWKDWYESFELSPKARPLYGFEYLRGGNIFFRRQVLDEMAGFDTVLGMSDKELGYCEETELQRRIREAMPDELIYYDPGLQVFHLVRPEKMTPRRILNSSFTCGRHSYNVYQDKNFKGVRPVKLNLLIKAWATLLFFFTDFFVGMLRRDREQYPYLQNYLYENTLQYVGVLGEIYEQYMNG